MKLGRSGRFFFAKSVDSQTLPQQHEALPNSKKYLTASLKKTQLFKLPEIQLKPFSFDKCPPYTAVSYMWGANPTLYEVKVNGKAFPVRPDLFALIFSFHCSQEPLYDERTKEPYSYGYLWIDALRSDQSNVEKRNSQVRLMGTIYSKATIPLHG